MPAERFVGEAGRLDVVLARLTGLTRADVQRAITAGHVTVDGVVRGKSFALLGGESLGMEIEDVAPLQPEGPAVPIRFRDEHLLVIAKPAGLVTHPTERRRSGTLVNRLLFMGVPLSSVGGPLRPGIVHRLDAGTSGLMLVAKTDEAHEALLAMFRRHDVERRYLALVRGRVEHEAFAVDAALGRHAARVILDRDRRAACRDPVRGPRAARLLHPARGGAADRPHPSDPGAPVVDRAPDPGGPRLRRGGGRRATLGAHAAVLALVARRVHAPDDR